MIPGIAITGAGGMTGWELARQAAKRGWNVTSYTRDELDITDPDAVAAAFRAVCPSVVVNAAAYTAVDRAESDRENAERVNRDGARNVARASAAIGAPVVHISTDYVFSGDAAEPYLPSDEPEPRNAYGASKLGGEIAVREESQEHAIIRTSWVFSHRGGNFVRTVLRLAGERDELRIVDDQRGRPTSAADLAAALLVVAEQIEVSREGGTWHFANAGVATWYELAEQILLETGAKNVRVVPIATSDFPTPASRPAYSVLDTTSFTERFGVVPRHWKDALRDEIKLL